jgi:hypothetical protein
MRLDLHPFKNIGEAREWGRAEIEAETEAARARFITLTRGQDAAYRAKYDEARAFIASGYALDAQAVPWIAVEAARSGLTLKCAAGVIKQRGDAWNLVHGPRIEALRGNGKDSLSGLQSVGEVVSAVRAVVAQLRQMKDAGAAPTN